MERIFDSHYQGRESWQLNDDFIGSMLYNERLLEETRYDKDVDIDDISMIA